jgi:hypothetical protein
MEASLTLWTGKNTVLERCRESFVENTSSNIITVASPTLRDHPESEKKAEVNTPWLEIMGLNPERTFFGALFFPSSDIFRPSLVSFQLTVIHVISTFFICM